MLVSKSAGLVNDGNPYGEALLNFALSSRNIMTFALSEKGTSQWDPVLDDADEFRAYEAVVARCEAALGWAFTADCLFRSWQYGSRGVESGTGFLLHLATIHSLRSCLVARWMVPSLCTHQPKSR